MSSGAPDYLTKGTNIIRDAISADEAGNLEEAKRLYIQACSWFEMVLKYEKNDNIRKRVKACMENYVGRCEQIAAQQMNPVANTPKKPIPAGVGGGGGAEDDETAKFEKALESVILVEKPNVSWDSVAGLELAKEALKEAVIFPAQLPHMFDETFSPWKGVLLYGPPGTGKSYLAKAIATEAKATFFNVTAADLISKWVGESERLVKALFNMARKRKPSIIFIDEVDSLCSARDGNDNIARVKTQFLIETQSVGKTETGVLVLGATNVPWSLDIGMRRRFERKIYIPLPSKEARMQLFKLCVGKSSVSLGNKDYAALADKTSGYSGADISTLTREAMMGAVRKVITATHFKMDGGGQFVPCSPGEEDAFPMLWTDVEGSKLKKPETGLRDFERAIGAVKCTVNTDDLVHHEEWTVEFGSSAE